MIETAVEDDLTLLRGQSRIRRSVERFAAIGSFALVVLVASNASTALKLGIGTPAYELSALLILSGLFLRIEVSDSGVSVKGLPWRVTLSFVLMTTFGFVQLMSNSWGPFEQLDGSFPESWSKDILIVAALVLTARSLADVSRLVWGLVAAISILGAPSLIQHLTGTYSFDWFGLAQAERGFIDGEQRYQIGGPLGGSNPLAQWLVVLVPFAVHTSRWGRTNHQRLLGSAAAVLAVAGTIATQSRQGMLVLLAAGLLIIAGYSRPSRSTMRKLVVVALVLVVAVVGSNPARWARQVERIGEAKVLFGGDIESDSSSAGYAGTLRAGIDMFVDYPITGVGHGNFATQYLTYASERGIDTSGRARAAHNSAIQVLAETGLVGALVFVASAFLLYLVLRRSRGRLRGYGDEEHAQLATAFAIACGIWLFSSLFQGLFHTEQILVVAGLVLALGTGAEALSPYSENG